MPTSLAIRELADTDEEAADRIFRRAFGTFLGVPDPSTTFGDSRMLQVRRRAPNTTVYGAYDGDTLVGSNVVSRWGSVGWFGPLTVDPGRWDQGIAGQLMIATEALFDRWHVTHRGLFTFPHSPKHLALYQRFGYWPGSLTPILERPVRPGEERSINGVTHRRFGGLPPADRAEVLAAVQELGSRLYAGLDLTGEVSSVAAQGIGDTVLQFDGNSLSGLAVCHVGAGSETESGSGYLKVGALRPGEGRRARLDALLSSAESLFASEGAETIAVGVNLEHRATYRALRERGYRPVFIGVAMHAPDGRAYHRPEFDVLDDWR